MKILKWVPVERKRQTANGNNAKMANAVQMSFKEQQEALKKSQAGQTLSGVKMAPTSHMKHLDEDSNMSVDSTNSVEEQKSWNWIIVNSKFRLYFYCIEMPLIINVAAHTWQWIVRIDLVVKNGISSDSVGEIKSAGRNAVEEATIGGRSR